ncbi:MAG TPA: amidohydrolase family protein [Candidatus Polarisedimenticolia bacterium]|nr:amidohydrolase family protein [Candidatus Polarisedimenticolia bacterium]
MPRLLIRGGLLCDGTGDPPRPADVLVEGGRVAEAGARLPAPAGTILEASGLVVAPGFIDLHSHGDLIHPLPPEAQRPLVAGRLAQGITTEIVGNCGLGVAPCPEPALPLLRAVVEWMTPGAAAGWPDGAWKDLGSYLARLEGQGTWINVGSLQAHGPLRVAAAGLERRAGPAARAAMRRALEEAMDAGAFGLSTGLIYPPGLFAPTAELAELAGIVARRGGGGLVASHIRGSSETLLPAVRELIALGRRSGARVQHSHCEAVGREHWPKIGQVLEMEDAARAQGVAVAHDMFPYTAAATMMLAIYPPWALEGGVGRLLQRLADPAGRAAIRESIESVVPSWPPWTPGGWPHNLVRAVGWDAITVGSVVSSQGRRYEGMSLVELGRARGASPFDAVCDLMLEERGKVSQIIHGISGEEGSEGGLEAILAHGQAAVCTDANDYGRGRPHPAAYGAFPRVLGRYVRERRVLSLQEAVHKMTGRPAGLLGLHDRGVVRRGAWADLVVFDAETIGSEATCAAPRRPASGIRWVLVNGEVACASGEPPPGARPSGRILRRQG